MGPQRPTLARRWHPAPPGMRQHPKFTIRSEVIVTSGLSFLWLSGAGVWDSTRYLLWATIFHFSIDLRPLLACRVDSRCDVACNANKLRDSIGVRTVSMKEQS